MDQTLKEFLQTKNINNAAFGRMVGVTGEAIGHYLARRRDPRREIRTKMEEVTGCQVILTTDNIYLSPPESSIP